MHELMLPKSAHTSRPWRVHEFAADFELEDVWQLAISAGRDDLERLVQLAVSLSAGYEYPALFRGLFKLRWQLGRLFGWDDEDTGIGERVSSLRERLPADLLAGPRGPDLRAVPGREGTDGPPIFVSLYQTPDEWLSEYASETVHSLMHIGWVRNDSGPGYHAQMAVLVKPNGWRGRAYMAAIKPFRCILYPLQLRALARQWEARAQPRRVTVTDPVAASRRYHYADAFELQLDRCDDSSPQQWLSAGVEETPAWIKRVAGHAGGLASAQVVERDAEVIVLESSDALMDTVMIARNLDRERRVLTTILSFKRPLLVRTIWAFLGILHRRTARRVLAAGLPRRPTS